VESKINKARIDNNIVKEKTEDTKVEMFCLFVIHMQIKNRICYILNTMLKVGRKINKVSNT